MFSLFAISTYLYEFCTFTPPISNLLEVIEGCKFGLVQPFLYFDNYTQIKYLGACFQKKLYCTPLLLNTWKAFITIYFCNDIFLQPSLTSGPTKFPVTDGGRSSNGKSSLTAIRDMLFFKDSVFYGDYLLYSFFQHIYIYIYTTKT